MRWTKENLRMLECPTILPASSDDYCDIRMQSEDKANKIIIESDERIFGPGNQRVIQFFRQWTLQELIQFPLHLFEFIFILRQSQSRVEYFLSCHV